jgi:cysteine desulfurase
MSTGKPVIYMDYHATTPVDPRVLEAMLPYFGEHFGNPASRNHAYGWAAEEAVEHAREQLARLIHAKAKEIVFTSGATESNNLAIKGVLAFDPKRTHMITAVTEHKSVLDACKAMERAGRATVTYLKVDSDGLVDPSDVRTAITPETALISIMFANNEIGTIAPIGEIGRIAKERGVFFHTDAAQALGKTPIDVDALGIDLLSFTAHKMYGPKGAGSLYVRSQKHPVRLTPLLDGGGHERGMRSGTLNVPGIVGLAQAAVIANTEMATEQARLLALRERLREAICTQLDDVRVNGHPTTRLAGNLNMSFAYVEGESLLLALNDVALSSGSACTSANLQPSHVLKALGMGDELAHNSLRFGLGRFTTEAEVEYVIARVVHEVRRLRELSPFYAAAKRNARASRAATADHSTVH